ncbi:hypothetical protein ACK3TF_003277 [Chlorella vulgaris]
MEAQARVLTGAKNTNEDMTKHLMQEEYLTSAHVVGDADLELWRGRGIDALKKAEVNGPKVKQTGAVKLLSRETFLRDEDTGAVAGKQWVVVHDKLDCSSPDGKLQYYRFHFTMLGDPRGKVAVVEGVLRGPCSKKMIDPTCSLTCSAVVQTQVNW